MADVTTPLPLAFDLETVPILRQIGRARTALGELKGLAESIPNQEILLSTLILQEAKESSAIENVVTSHEELLQARSLPQGQIDPATKEVLRYEEAVRIGFEAVRAEGLIRNAHVIRIQAALRGFEEGFRTTPGTVLVNAATREVVHRPPQQPEEVRALMANLELYLNEDGFDASDPLIKMAVAHHQFESIHPFTDGNGRTGRILNVLFLVREGLLRLPILYLSRYIIADKSGYYRHLSRARRSEEGYRAYVEWMLRGVEVTALETIRIIERLRDLMRTYKRDIRALGGKIYSQDLLNLLFRYPYTTTELIMDGLDVSRPTATKYLKRLAEAGLLDSRQHGRRVIYLNEPLFDLMSRRVEYPQVETVESVSI